MDIKPNVRAGAVRFNKCKKGFVAFAMMKRRRVSKACNECHRRKIKCDAKHPCAHCIMYGHECSYKSQYIRGGGHSKTWIEDLQKKLQRLEGGFKTIFPGIDVDDPNLLVNVQRNFAVKAIEIKPIGFATSKASGLTQTATNTEQDALETIFDAVGRLDLDNQGNWDYHGPSSGPAFLQQLEKRFQKLAGYAEHSAGMLRLETLSDIPWPLENIPQQLDMSNTTALPPKSLAEKLVSAALDDACALLRFTHRPTVDFNLKHLYGTSPESWNRQDQKFLPLLYSLLALGCLYTNEDAVTSCSTTLMCEGVKYFVACRSLIDISDCRDLLSLQALIAMVYFLHSAAKVSVCHSYISVALASSLQIGLHRHTSVALPPIERETRKRVIWAIRNMQTYICAISGLPTAINDDDIDQEMPTEVDDEFIIEDRILPAPSGPQSVASAMNAHTRLLNIFSKVLRYVYPVKNRGQGLDDEISSYKVSYARVCELQKDLQCWVDALPWAMTPEAALPPNNLRVQLLLLRIAYLHVQLVLYRPFLHNVSNTEGDCADPRSAACAMACISAARTIIQSLKNMEETARLSGPYWFITYSTFFATTSLLFYVWNRTNSPGVLQILRDAENGRDLLSKLSYKSIVATRCAIALSTPFNMLSKEFCTEESGVPEYLVQGRPLQDSATPQASDKFKSGSHKTSSADTQFHNSSTLMGSANTTNIDPEEHESAGSLGPIDCFEAPALTSAGDVTFHRGQSCRDAGSMIVPGSNSGHYC